jgi:hypothetical protein
MAEQHLNCVFVTADKVVNRFVKLGLLEEIAGFQRNRRFRYAPYLALFEPVRNAEKPTPKAVPTNSEKRRGDAQSD